MSSAIARIAPILLLAARAERLAATGTGFSWDWNDDERNLSNIVAVGNAHCPSIATLQP